MELRSEKSFISPREDCCYNVSFITVDLYSFPFYFVWLIYRPTDEAGGLMGYFGKALSPSSYLPVHVSGVFVEHCVQ